MGFLQKIYREATRPVVQAWNYVVPPEPEKPEPTPPSGSPFGIPLPPKTGAELGTDAAAYYSTAFPGTNPWERLGAGNPAGAVETSQIAAKQQQRGIEAQLFMQQRELNTRKDVAEKQAKTGRFTAILGGLGKLATSLPGSYATLSKLGPEMTKLKYGSGIAPGLFNLAKDTGITGAVKGAISKYYGQ